MKRMLAPVLAIPLFCVFIFTVVKLFAVHKLIGEETLILTVAVFAGWHALLSLMFWPFLRGPRLLLFCNISNILCAAFTLVLMIFLTTYLDLKGGAMQTPDKVAHILSPLFVGLVIQVFLAGIYLSQGRTTTN